MKSNTLSLFAAACLAAALFLPSCSREEARPLSDFKEATAADSLYFMLGELRAHDYWQHANGDTVLRNPENVRDFIRGVKYAISAVERGNQAYNDGLRLGFRMVTTMNELSDN